MTAVVASLLPMAVVGGKRVASRVPAPGSAQAVPAGTIVPWPSLSIPAGWLMCDGQAASRLDHADLFKVIGTAYGAGDLSTTFNLPDLRGRTVVGLDNMGTGAANVIVGAWADKIGGTYGEEEHQLTIAEMPAHGHSFSYWATAGGGGSGWQLQINNVDGYRNTDSTGGNVAHNNMQPSIALCWIIKG
ncbi:MAG: tail fiber protein [Candidatus Omnitrophica bacterium]|nr:tail fiber protein [Candidatus Omnitrophota bacterium]